MRALLAEAGADPAEVALATEGPGYMLRTDPERIDAHRFNALVREARENDTDAARALDLLDQALALWRGPALADAASDEIRDRLCAGLEEARLVAVEDRLDALLRLGRHRAAVGEATALAEAHPDRERVIGLAMLALHRCGSSNQALDLYRRTRPGQPRPADHRDRTTPPATPGVPGNVRLAAIAPHLTA